MTTCSLVCVKSAISCNSDSGHICQQSNLSTVTLSVHSTFAYFWIVSYVFLTSFHFNSSDLTRLFIPNYQKSIIFRQLPSLQFLQIFIQNPLTFIVWHLNCHGDIIFCLLGQHHAHSCPLSRDLNGPSGTYRLRKGLLQTHKKEFVPDSAWNFQQFRNSLWFQRP